MPLFTHDPCTLKDYVRALSEDAVSSINCTTLLSNRPCGGIRRTFARCDGRQNLSRNRNKECTFTTPSKERARSQCEVTRVTRCPHRLSCTHWQRVLWVGWVLVTFCKYCVLLQQRWQDSSRRAPEIHRLLDQNCKLNYSFGTNKLPCSRI
jgi:hypothetical protein